MNTEQERAELLPCPFCGCAMSLSAVARDWWRITGGHNEDCILYDHRHDAPQTAYQKQALIEDWNRRAALQSQADPLLPKSPEWPKWYVVSKQGHATLYESESSARGSVRLRNDAFPESAPHAAMPLIPALQSQDRKDTFCVWHNDPETDNSWDTSCRQLFELYDGTPTENGMKFCCYCGGSLVEHIDHARRIEEGAK